MMVVVSGDNWNYKICKASVKTSTPTNQRLTFYTPDALPVAQLTSVQALKEEGSQSTDLLTPSSHEGLLPGLDH